MSSARVRALSLPGGLLLAAGAASAEPPQAIGAPEGFVDIVAWPGYIERGEPALPLRSATRMPTVAWTSQRES